MASVRPYILIISFSFSMNTQMPGSNISSLNLPFGTFFAANAK